MLMGVRSAELTKYAANAMLATRISFMNELANLAERLGADIEEVRRGIGSDPRIGYALPLRRARATAARAFPKDVQGAAAHRATRPGRPLRVLAAVEQVNEAQKHVLGGKIKARFGEDLQGKRIALWGLAFKPNTDDMREAPSRTLIADLLARGATVRAYDPVAGAEARKLFAKDGGVRIADSAMRRAARAADALAIVTEWAEFRSPDFARAEGEALQTPVIFDGRNLYDPAMVARARLRVLSRSAART